MTDFAATFGFREWPFRVVVDEDFARVWADRADVRTEIERRLAILDTLPHSTVQLIWADFGAGKSHTLRFMENWCRRSPSSNLIPAYIEIPSNFDGLKGLFQRLCDAIPDDLLAALGGIALARLPQGGGTAGARDMRQALRLLASGDATASGVAREWLTASRGTPHLRVLKSHGISSRIEDDGRVVEVLTELVRVLRVHKPGGSVVWFVDEYQRVAEASSKQREGLSQALVSLFNACPSGLHLVLSLSVAQQSTASAMLAPALRSRASTFPLLTLQHLSKADALLFVKDLMAAFHKEPTSADYFPFTLELLQELGKQLTKMHPGGITPRALMEDLGRFLFEVHASTGGTPILPLTLSASSDMLKRRTEAQ